MMRTFFLLILVLTFVPASTAANMANPERPGGVVGELMGDVSDLAVEREVLEFDLRPIADGEPGRVQATYTIRNDHGSMPLELQFVALNMETVTDAVEVSMNGQPVPFDVREDAPIPERWQFGEKNRRLMAFFEEGSWEEDANRTSIFFEVAVAPGRHDIRVSYPVKPWENTWVEGLEQLPASFAGSRYSDYTVPYILAPARDWGEFGTLEIKVQAPSRWDIVASPQLDQGDDNVLSGSFEGIPADGVFFTLRPKTIPSLRVGMALALFFIVWFGLVVAVPYRLSRRPIFGLGNAVDAKNEHNGKSMLVALILTALCALFGMPAAIVVHEVVGATPHTYPGWGYGLFYFGFFGVMISLVVSTLIFTLGFVRD